MWKLILPEIANRWENFKVIDVMVNNKLITFVRCLCNHFAHKYAMHHAPGTVTELQCVAKLLAQVDTLMHAKSAKLLAILPRIWDVRQIASRTESTKFLFRSEPESAKRNRFQAVRYSMERAVDFRRCSLVGSFVIFATRSPALRRFAAHIGS